MSDNLVKRLRKIATQTSDDSTATEAADRIEAICAQLDGEQFANHEAADRIKALETALRRMKCYRQYCIVETTPNAMEYYETCCIARRALEGK